jgi:hypothetical protein
LSKAFDARLLDDIEMVFAAVVRIVVNAHSYGQESAG